MRRCECADPGCPAHVGAQVCFKPQTTTLYRIDMSDETGTTFCAACTDDAWETGLYSDRRTRTAVLSVQVPVFTSELAAYAWARRRGLDPKRAAWAWIMAKERLMLKTFGPRFWERAENGPKKTDTTKQNGCRTRIT